MGGDDAQRGATPSTLAALHGHATALVTLSEGGGLGLQEVVAASLVGGALCGALEAAGRASEREIQLARLVRSHGTELQSARQASARG
eukprot:SAG11_NODE_36298_length_262_cov_0.889571_1_plen_87_part_11